MFIPDVNSVPATAEELLAMVREQAAWVETCLQTLHSSWTPNLAIKCRDLAESSKDGKWIMMALAVDFNTDEEKHRTMFQIGQRLYRDQVMPACVVFTCEAWQAEQKVPHVQPKDCPDRKEVIVLMGASLGNGHLVHASMPISRDRLDMIVPSKFPEPITSGLQMNLLGHLWRGYFDEVIQKFGMPPRRSKAR